MYHTGTHDPLQNHFINWETLGWSATHISDKQGTISNRTIYHYTIISN